MCHPCKLQQFHDEKETCIQRSTCGATLLSCDPVIVVSATHCQVKETFSGGSLKKTPCNGDAGGPLVTRATEVDSNFSLIGVDSFGDYCEGKKPTVFSEVSHFIPWIAEQYGLSLP